MQLRTSQVIAIGCDRKIKINIFELKGKLILKLILFNSKMLIIIFDH